MKACAPLVVGGLLIAAAILPMKAPYWQFAAFMEWVGAFLAFTGLSYLLSPRFAFFFSVTAFVLGTLIDALFAGFSPIGWSLTNYMVFVHSFLGVLIGNLLKHGGVTFKS